MTRLIIARHNENLDWIHKHLPNATVSIIEKSDGEPHPAHIKKLENVGREPHSFLWYILNHYETIMADEVYVFLQGNPYDHCRNLDAILGTIHRVNGFAWLANELFYCEPDGSPHDAGLHIPEIANVLGIRAPRPLGFGPGGQFAVTGERILKRPKAVYERALALTTEGRNAWAFERLWEKLFEE